MPNNPDRYTTVLVHRQTRDDLLEARHQGEAFDDTIRRLLGKDPIERQLPGRRPLPPPKGRRHG